MAISVQCGSCGRAYTLNESLAGRRFRCRQCGEAIQAPMIRPAPGPIAPDLMAELTYPVAQGYPTMPLGFESGYLSSETALPPRSSPRRNSINGLAVGLAVAGGLLAVLGAVVMLVAAAGFGVEGWITLAMAPGRERNKIRSIKAVPVNPAAQFAKSAPPVAPPPAPAPAGPSVESVLQQALAAINRLKATFAGINDEASARQRADEVVAGMQQIIDLVDKNLEQYAPVTVAESRRLQAIYKPQIDAANAQLKLEIVRVMSNRQTGPILAQKLRASGVEARFNQPMRRPLWAPSALQASPRRSAHHRMAALTAPTPLESGDPFAKFPEREVVEIVIRGSPSGFPPGFGERVSKRIHEITSCQIYAGKGVNSEMRVTFAPVRDVRALAAQIDFGKVVALNVSQSLIVVDAEP